MRKCVTDVIHTLNLFHRLVFN